VQGSVPRGREPPRASGHPPRLEPPGLEAANNEKEALNFERLLNDGGKGIGGVSGGPLGFHGLDAIVVGISALSVEETQRALADKLLLTMPFLSDPKRELISAYGAKPGGLPDIVQA
jgi:hypothetical protein